MSIANAEVKIAHGELKKLLDERDAAVTELETLKKARTPDWSHLDKILAEAVDDASKVIQWAVAMIEPENYRGWPHEALTRFGQHLRDTACGDQNRHDLGLNFQHFADECREIEDIRIRRHQAAREIVGMAPAGDEDTSQSENGGASVPGIGTSPAPEAKAAATDLPTPKFGGSTGGPLPPPPAVEDAP